VHGRHRPAASNTDVDRALDLLSIRLSGSPTRRTSPVHHVVSLCSDAIDAMGKLTGEQDILKRGFPRQQNRLLKHEAYLARCNDISCRLPVDGDASVVRLDQPANRLKECAFPAPRRTDKTNDPPAIRSERYPIQSESAYWMRLADRDYTSLSTVTSILSFRPGCDVSARSCLLRPPCANTTSFL
jgi:hypothetical protein